MPRNAFQALFLLALGLSLLAPACKSNKGAAQSEKEAEEKKPDEATKKADETKLIQNPFFYTIEGPNGASGHLLGSMHMGVDAKTELPKRVWDAFNDASLLVIEADITDVSIAKEMMLPEGQNLMQLLGDEHWKLLEEKIGAPAAKSLAAMKPAAAAATISMKDLPITMPMELSFIGQAQEKEIGVDFLETAAFQSELLNRIMDIDFLKHMLETAEASDTKELLATYRNGDEAGLLKAMTQPEAWGKDFEATIEAMLYARNDDWIPKLEKLYASKKVFVAVGAGHLVGPRGVIESLRKKGYTVERSLP